MPIQHISKPQPTLMGFSAWAFERLVRVKRQSAATVAAQIIEQWLDASREELSSKWNIKFEDWEKQLELEDKEEKLRNQIANEAEQGAQRSSGPKRISE